MMNIVKWNDGDVAVLIGKSPSLSLPGQPAKQINYLQQALLRVTLIKDLPHLLPNTVYLPPIFNPAKGPPKMVGRLPLKLAASISEPPSSIATCVHVH
jgi:hypothetical protein